MKIRIVFPALFVVFLLFTVGCNNDVFKPDNDLNDSGRINKFIVSCVKNLYLWESETDWNMYDNYNTLSLYDNHYSLFNELMYKDDRWSMLTDNINELKAIISGVTLTYGYKISIIRNTKDNSLYALVLFTYPDTPASNAGIKRGDIIVGIDGEKITESNYRKLNNSSSISIDMGYYDGETIQKKQGETVLLTAVETYENPILKYTVIERGAHKIGYLCYADYVIKSEADLIKVFSEFKDRGITDFVLDLRYNSGGTSQTAKMLSSILAPASTVRNKDVYMTKKWNNLFMSIQDDDELNEYFDNTLPVNMDFKKLYVLTSDMSASASEATIIGLKSCMEVILIGDTTLGKYFGGYLLSPEDYYRIIPEKGIKRDYYENYNNWGMYLMIYRFSNKNGYPQSVNGLVPDILALEDELCLVPFGDKSDPLLGRALELITGEVYMKTFSAPVNRSLFSAERDKNVKRALDGKFIYTGDLPVKN